MTDAVPLDQFIQALRDQLEEAILNKPKRGLHFDLGEIELELHVTAQTKKDVGAKLAFNVVGLSGGLSSTHSQTNVIKLKLKPKLTTSDGSYRPVDVSEQSERPGGPKR